MKSVATALLHCPKVELLWLENNDLSDPEASNTLGGAIKKMISVTSLDLDSCTIGADGMKSVTTALLQCPQVENLWLRSNDLSNPEASAVLGDSIQKIKKLDLDSCNIGADGMLAVVTALLNSPNVVVLMLRNNDLSDPEASKALGEFIQKMTSLQKLSLASCNIGAGGMQAVTIALLHCPKVELLAVRSNVCSDAMFGVMVGWYDVDTGMRSCSSLVERVSCRRIPKTLHQGMNRFAFGFNETFSV
ncbi:hypothetical protein LSAT2_006667 [Lamellibrachia satsuma]|nr:hypothetical protein LSAT2_006667 [Lamellibrachia satsuma]